MCKITLTDFRGVADLMGGVFNGPGTPPYIQISGTITGCPPVSGVSIATVSVKTSCSPITGAGVNADGTFSCIVSNTEHCPCDGKTSPIITVTCDGNPNDPTCHITVALPLKCGAPTQKPCPLGSPFAFDNTNKPPTPSIKFTEGPCDPNGNRDVTATVTILPGWSLSNITWAWGNNNAAVPSINPPTNPTSPPESLKGGAAYLLVVTAYLAAPNQGCSYSIARWVNVSPCPFASGSSMPSTSSKPSCGFLVGVALMLLAVAAVGLAVGGCLGPAGAPFTQWGATLSLTGLAALGLWIAFCHDCVAMRFLRRFFGAMAVMMLIISAVLSLVGMALCAAGAVAVAALLGAIVGVLTMGILIWRCP
jgi:hypothetical protein